MYASKHYALATALCLTASIAAAQTTAAPPSPAPVRLRGTVQSVNANRLTLKERSGEVVELALAERLVVPEVFPIATVAEVVSTNAARTMIVKYQRGEKTIAFAPDTPVVTFKPGARSLLVPGASVSIAAQALDGVPTALRISAGRDGFVIPY